MSKQLIVVESPTKAKTLTRFLGSDYDIEASMGHVRDLPKSKLGVDVEADFSPEYVIPKAKRKTVEHLKDLLINAKEIILATDPDREGEAIAWHVSQLAVRGEQKAEKLKIKNTEKSNNSEPITQGSKFKRIVFHEITKEAILEALKSPRQIDIKLVDAQVARRVLDRLVGYKLSPLLWQKVKRGLSAGRVQSVAVRLIVEREREIDKFVAVEYWSVGALLQQKGARDKKQEFLAELSKIDDKKAEVKNKKEAEVITSELENKDTGWQVTKQEQKDVKKYPSPPFTTSTLTQTAANNFGFTAKKTMKLAQDLYEEGLITYHRTDSVNIAAAALSAARKFIEKEYGKKYLPASARIYKTKSKLAQEAHEAIRPTSVEMVSEKLKIPDDHKKLYSLIWNRFVTSQMAEAIYDQVTLEIIARRQTQNDKSFLFRAAGSIVKFPGWMKVYGREEGQAAGDQEKLVPPLAEGTNLDLLKLIPEQHFTQPPPRYTEASLIKTLEEQGIGRPSTYAPIISTIQDRHYVELQERKFKPTPIGIAVNDFLVENFPHLIDVPFTATLEEQLDDVANGEKKWVPLIREFYGPFEKHLEKVSDTAGRVKVFTEATGEKCPEGHNLVIRYGRFGKFLACEKFPEHKFTKNFEEKVNAKCPESGHDIVLLKTRRGRPFYGCAGYPKCKWMSWKDPTKKDETPAEAEA